MPGRKRQHTLLKWAEKTAMRAEKSPWEQFENFQTSLNILHPSKSHSTTFVAEVKKILSFFCAGFFIVLTFIDRRRRRRQRRNDTSVVGVDKSCVVGWPGWTPRWCCCPGRSRWQRCWPSATTDPDTSCSPIEEIRSIIISHFIYE